MLQRTTAITKLDAPQAEDAKAHEVPGSDKADNLSGTSGNDNIHGGAGHDTIHGSGGNDHLYGDAGNDTFTFGDVSGHSTVDGGSGNWSDTIEINVGGDQATHGGWTVDIEGDHGSDKSGNIIGKICPVT